MAGKRYSRQRELICQAVCGTDQHPTAEMVYHWLKPANPNLSLGTVYRNLNLLAEEGILLRMTFSVERYDANTMPHTHFRCKSCGGVFDLDLAYDSEIDARAAAAEPGFQIESHDLIFSGLCPHCGGKKKKLD